MDISKLRPLHGFIILQFPKEPEVFERHGLVIPGMSSESRRWRVATVVARDERGIPTKAGTRCKHQVSVGDKVVIDRIFGDRIYEGEKETAGLRVVSEDQIEGIVETSEDINLETMWMDF